MSVIYRIIVGAIGLAILVGTAVFVVQLLAARPDPKVLLAGYMAIGGILLGAYSMFYAITGKWRPNLTRRQREP